MFAKIFSQIYDSSIAENYTTRHVFMDLLVLCDSEGVVDMTPAAIARRTNIPLNIIDAALLELMLPDPESRSHEANGCRIIPIDSNRDWGWQIVNYQHYRNLVDEEARRTYFRDYRRKERANKRVQSVQPCSTPFKKVTHAEAEAEAEETSTLKLSSVGHGEKPNKPKKKKPSASPKGPTLADDVFIAELKRHHSDIDVSRELGKMRSFLLLPKCKGRKMTRSFVVNWLNRCDAPMKGESVQDEKRSQANGYFGKEEATGVWTELGMSRAEWLKSPEYQEWLAKRK